MKMRYKFLGFVVLAQRLRMEEEKIKAVKNWPEPQSIRDIWVFLDFTNFYKRFIRNFSRIAAPLTSMLQTIGDNDLGAQTIGIEENQDVATGVAELVVLEVSKICRPLQNRLSPKCQID